MSWFDGSCIWKLIILLGMRIKFVGSSKWSVWLVLILLLKLTLNISDLIIAVYFKYFVFYLSNFLFLLLASCLFSALLFKVYSLRLILIEASIVISGLIYFIFNIATIKDWTFIILSQGIVWLPALVLYLKIMLQTYLCS